MSEASDVGGIIAATGDKRLTSLRGMPPLETILVEQSLDLEALIDHGIDLVDVVTVKRPEATRREVVGRRL
jgi:hypothetical protein